MDLKKLRDMEIAPSERANELFRSRLEQLPAPVQKNRTAYFATAAAVLLALGILFALRFQQEDNVATIAQENGAQATLPASSPSEKPGTSQQATPQPGTPQPGAPQPGAPLPNAEKVFVSEKADAQEPAKQAEKVIPVLVPEISRIENPQQAEGSDLKRLTPGIHYHYHPVELTNFALLDVHQGMELETEGPATLAATAAPLPLLARMVREVRYVVNGDKPDLDRAGIKPAATVLAYNQNGILANESRQVKEGVLRFKEIFR